MDKHRTYESTSSIPYQQQQQRRPAYADDQQTLQYCLYQVQKLHGESPAMARELEMVLPMIMNDCVVSNIEAGKNWIFKNCQRSDQCEAVLDYINALAKVSPHFSHRLHLLYLINDVLHHAVARQMIWMKNAILPHLSTLLCLGYQCPSNRNIPEQQERIIKLINIWEENRFFDSATIHNLRQDINNKASTTLPFPALAHPLSTTSSFDGDRDMTSPGTASPSTTLAHRPVKPYYELPAGLMTVALKVDQPPYTPIDPLSVRERPSHHRKPPSKEMLHAVETFYAGLKMEPLKPLSATVGNNATVTVGWEAGYLDKFYQKFQSTLQQRVQQSEPSRSSKSHDHHRYSTTSRGRSPPGPRRRESSVERRKSRRSRSRSRSHSPTRKSDHHRQHDYRSSRRRSISSERHARREINRPPPPLSSSSSSYHRYPAATTSPPMSNTYQASHAATTPKGSGRMGLGHGSAPADAFDEFRKRSSYNFTKEASQRDVSAGPKCYNCGKYGHFAKTCDAHLGKS